MHIRRLSPEDYLAHYHRERRGHLKLYIGAAPGVGKTFQMLEDAHLVRGEGRDVCIGIVVTHGRKETAVLVEGLEQIPLVKTEYKGRTFEELNVEGILKRQPEIVLVDELAHTNAPGSVRKKRFEDVLCLVEAGIEVWCAVNIQHFEHVYNHVERIAGIAVNERVPNVFLRHVDEMQLVDVSTDTLRKRLIDGKIYPANKINQSLTHFFTDFNLTALRELVLRELADEIDSRNEAPVRIKERILVCVHQHQTAAKLIRRGFKIAQGHKGDLYVVTIVQEEQLKRLEVEHRAWETLTRQLGGTFRIVPKRNQRVAGVIETLTNELGITQILLGQSARTRWDEILKGSIVNEIMRSVSKVDLHIVSDDAR
ncbi:MAG: universal stress protein [Bacilli bacterium]